MTQEKKLYILRGIPGMLRWMRCDICLQGSGKSTLGRELLKGTSGSVFSTDDFFLDETGNGYHFDPKQYFLNTCKFDVKVRASSPMESKTK